MNYLNNCLNRIITKNLIDQSKDTEHLKTTLLPDEKCQLCGCELSPGSKNNDSGLCGKCYRTLRPKYCIVNIDKRINSGHGHSFMDALDIAIKRGDFN